MFPRAILPTIIGMVPHAYNKMAILCWHNRYCKQHIANDERLWGMLMLMSMQMLLAELPRMPMRVFHRRPG
jgi:hypothetical protein